MSKLYTIGVDPGKNGDAVVLDHTPAPWEWSWRWTILTHKQPPPRPRRAEEDDRMTPAELEEFERLEWELRGYGLGDRPEAPSAKKLRRFFHLSDKRAALRAEVEAGYQNALREVAALVVDREA